jgi:hypothetical protein
VPRGRPLPPDTWFEVTIRIVEGPAIDLDVKIAVQDDSYY